MTRPKEVSTFLFLLSFSLLIGMGRSLLSLSMSQPLEMSPSAQGLGLIAVATLGFILIYQIALAKKWARVVFSVLVLLACLGLPQTLQMIRFSEGMNSVSAALGLAQVIIQVAGIGLLYRPASRSFFASSHSSKT